MLTQVVKPLPATDTLSRDPSIEQSENIKTHGFLELSTTLFLYMSNRVSSMRVGGSGSSRSNKRRSLKVKKIHF